MSATQGAAPDLRMQQAIDELQSLVQDRYPTAQFEVATAPDDSAAVHLLVTVDTDDTDEVVDLVIDRMVQLRTDDHLPILVIPLQTPERAAKPSRRSG